MFKIKCLSTRFIFTMELLHFVWNGFLTKTKQNTLLSLVNCYGLLFIVTNLQKILQEYIFFPQYTLSELKQC